MITLIQTKEDFNKKLPQLIASYKKMFSETPFNNNSITSEKAEEFFINTFENGYIFVDTKSDLDRVYGFRTAIRAKHFRDFDKFDMAEDAHYLSALWIDKNIRGRGLGNDLMKFSLKEIKKITGLGKFYVRTRRDTPEIHNVLLKNKFNSINEYSTVFDNKTVELIVWERD